MYRDGVEEGLHAVVIDIHLDQTLELRQAPVLSHRQIMAVRLLQLPSQELMRAIAQERDINPAIELSERDSCYHCGVGVESGAHICPACGMRLAVPESYHDEYLPVDVGAGAVASSAPDGDDNTDPLIRVAGTTKRGDGLLQMLHVMISEDERAIAEYLVGNLDHHGYLPGTIVEDTARELSCTFDLVEHVLSLLQRLDPPGIGARSAQECLLIQLRRLEWVGNPRKLAELLVRDYLHALAFRRFREVAHAVGKAPKIVEAEWQFIREHLYPYPTHGFDPDCDELVDVAASIRPDVVIRRRGAGFEAEVVEQQRYDLQIHRGYQWAYEHVKEIGGSLDDQEHIYTYVDRARSFIAALRQRWVTMQRVSDTLIDLQRDFLEYGPRALKPLTRAEVAEVLEVHESTVSRATDGKFVLLPSSRIVPFDDFFDSSLPVKVALRQLVAGENPKRPLSDEQLADRLKHEGFDIARRTVAKYREDEGILASRLRRNRSA